MQTVWRSCDLARRGLGLAQLAIEVLGVTAAIHGTHTVGPWAGFGLMCLFIAAAMAAAFLLLARRDT